MAEPDDRSLGYRVRLICLNLQFYPLFFVYSLIMIPALTVFITAVAIFRPRPVVLRRLRRAIAWYGWGIIRVLPLPWLRIQYTDLAPDAGMGPFVLIVNHRSASDPFLMAVLPYEGIQLVNIWPLRLPVLGLIAKLGGYLSIREMDVEEFYRVGGALLNEGCSIVSFPEGTRSAGRRVGAFTSSIFRLALQSQKPIVPLCISGNEKAPTKGSLVLHPGVIRIRKLPPVPWSEYGELTPFQLKKKIRDMIIAELEKMEGPAEAAPDNAPDDDADEAGPAKADQQGT